MRCFRTFSQELSFLPDTSQAQRVEGGHSITWLCGTQTSSHSQLGRPSLEALRWVLRAGKWPWGGDRVRPGGWGRRASQGAPGGTGSSTLPYPARRAGPPLRTLDNEVRRTRSPQRVPLLAAAMGGLARHGSLRPSATHADRLRPPAGAAAQAQTRRLVWEVEARTRGRDGAEGRYVITGRRSLWVPERRSECSGGCNAWLGWWSEYRKLIWKLIWIENISEYRKLIWKIWKVSYLSYSFLRLQELTG